MSRSIGILDEELSDFFHPILELGFDPAYFSFKKGDWRRKGKVYVLGMGCSDLGAWADKKTEQEILLSAMSAENLYRIRAEQVLEMLGAMGIPDKALKNPRWRSERTGFRNKEDNRIYVFYVNVEPSVLETLFPKLRIQEQSNDSYF